ncbi:MAG: NTP transferase domain-containing protein [Gudongella sp.]|jgi:GTP:adenosylcobinamide-phosphate guanylyltransferase|nr:NTP transferase domain-containing protein [Gudongella sp.]
MKINAIVMAGDVLKPGDLLYEHAKETSKSMIIIAGKTLLQWVIEALDESERIDSIIVVGLKPIEGIGSKKPLYYIKNNGSMLDNILVGSDKSLELNPEREYVMLVSSDTPKIKGEMADWFFDVAMETRDDFYYGVCSREMMESKFPTSNRTYVKLRDMEVCGSDIGIINIKVVREHMPIWEALIGKRKTPLRQAALIGIGTLIGVLFKSYTLEGLAKKVSRRIGIKARAIVWNCPEPCMDIDKPHQLDILKDIIETNHSDFL